MAVILACAGAAVQCSWASAVRARSEFPCPQPSSAENSRCRSPRARTRRFSLSATFTAAADLLAALIDEAAREPRRREKRAIVFLGDLVDRGPDSLGAIDLAIGAAARIGADEGIALMGNHEAMMRLALDPATPWDVAIEALETWIANGGDRTLAEFVEADEPPEDLDELLDGGARVAAGARARLARKLARRAGARATSCSSMPASTRVSTSKSFSPPRGICRLPASTKSATGPGCAGRSSSIGRGREGFGGVFVVHGHTPNDARRDASHEDQIAGFRLNLDAGSGLTGSQKWRSSAGAARRWSPRADRPTASSWGSDESLRAPHPSGIPALRMPS